MVQLGCLDIRRANESLIRERHHIPKLEDILPELNNAKYFSKIELREGYHQIELDPSSWCMREHFSQNVLFMVQNQH